eukprot:3655985-Pleurochrysis_carterae.AAC.2
MHSGCSRSGLRFRYSCASSAVELSSTAIIAPRSRAAGPLKRSGESHGGVRRIGSIRADGSCSGRTNGPVRTSHSARLLARSELAPSTHRYHVTSWDETAKMRLRSAGVGDFVMSERRSDLAASKTETAAGALPRQLCILASMAAASSANPTAGINARARSKYSCASA